jgi:NADH:ubiquinone oxidoreductase subunit F (NADH-binding)
MPTLVHNVETVATVAMLAALGVERFCGVGLSEEPGTGLFSVGRFGGPFQLIERPFGTPLLEVLAACGLASDARAALVGGWSGGIIPRERFDVPLSTQALRAAGLTLGTRSIQVFGETDSIVAAVAEILRFFAGNTAEQCPPCHRGLPELAQLFDRLTRGQKDGREEVTAAELEEWVSFASALTGRGLCGLPDGAARVVRTLMSHFPGEVRALVP